MEIALKDISVLERPGGTDIIFLHTSLPYPFTYDRSGKTLTMQFEATKGFGVEYAETCFPGVDIKVIRG